MMLLFGVVSYNDASGASGVKCFFSNYSCPGLLQKRLNFRSYRFWWRYRNDIFLTFCAAAENLHNCKNFCYPEIQQTAKYKSSILEFACSFFRGNSLAHRSVINAKLSPSLIITINLQQSLSSYQNKSVLINSVFVRNRESRNPFARTKQTVECKGPPHFSVFRT